MQVTAYKRDNNKNRSHGRFRLLRHGPHDLFGEEATNTRKTHENMGPVDQRKWVSRNVAVNSVVLPSKTSGCIFKSTHSTLSTVACKSPPSMSML